MHPSAFARGGIGSFPLRLVFVGGAVVPEFLDTGMVGRAQECLASESELRQVDHDPEHK